ncbi:YecA family protein [Butyrivibrio sp.]|uniref:YecA family protein n=1 Tax=Butyrivibrio sp. TaxID=28121 RepID=UPI0025EE7253|nr:SEC-C metal-binding domain-containing protein [Butyrivibrio sp.]
MKTIRNNSDVMEVMMNIGINGPCPCGSGKKYKYCCLNKEKKDIYASIRDIVEKEAYSDDLADVLCNLVRFMKEKKWIGACHATATILYVLLAELGYNVEIYSGEVDKIDFLPFDHSWITIDGKIIDIAVIMTLMNGMPVSDAIVLDKNVMTSNPYDLRYGVKSAIGLDEGTKRVINMSISEYMDSHPESINFLWEIAQRVSPCKLDINTMRKKYADKYRVYYVKE